MPKRLRSPALAVVLAAGLVAVLLLAAVHGAAPDSDAATVLLEGHSMAAGNLALAGWSLSRDSFWTSEALCYLVATAIAGVHAALLRVVPALIGAAIVLLGCRLAGRDRRPAAAVAGGAVVVAVLALPGPALSQFFLQSGFHVGTALLCLASFALLASGRLGWNWVAAVVLLAMALLGDLQAAAFGLAPLVAAGAVGMARRRDWAAALPEWSAAAAAVLLAAFGRELADRTGTFGVNGGNPTAPLGQMLSSNLRDLTSFGGELLGLPGSRLAASASVPPALGWLHLASVAGLVLALLVALGSLAKGARRGAGRAVAPDAAGDAETTSGRSRQGWLDDVLLLATLADLAVFLRLDEPSGTAPFARYLTAALVFSTVLAARLVARGVERLLGDGSPPRRSRRSAPSLAATAGLALLGTYAASFALAVDRPAARQPASRLAAYLEAHHLHEGLADYWTASITTVESGGAVVVRPVIDSPSGTVQRYQRQSDASWYAGRRFGFVAFDAALPLVDGRTVAATFGAPKSVAVVGPYRVVLLAHQSRVGTSGVTG